MVIAIAQNPNGEKSQLLREQHFLLMELSLKSWSPHICPR